MIVDTRTGEILDLTPLKRKSRAKATRRRVKPASFKDEVQYLTTLLAVLTALIAVVS
jgi:hypothetical protein